MVTQKKILVVEDNALNRAMLVEILADRYTTLEAENGQVALDILRADPDSIALILLDVVMPVMDGYTFLDIVKQDARLSLVPVIIVTQSNSEDAEVTALAHGAADFVPKPYRPKVILHRIASIIHLRETAAMMNQFQYDRLTRLYSKEFFFQKAQEILVRNPGKAYNIVCSNIVNFKLYNDTFGIPAGDRLLINFAAGIAEYLGEEGVAGRYTADRFVCLQERGRETAQRTIRERMRRAGTPEDQRNVEVKWGIYEIVDRSVPIEYMCDRAMLAADSIKGQYNQSIAIYDDILRRKLLREQSITSTMESALAGNQFTVYFQPKYRASDSRLCGAEALVRWIHPEWGFMSPGEFIPLFEKNGFISKLDQFVWERTCQLLRLWQGKGYPPLPISVNVSRADVYQSDLADFLLALTKKYGVDPKLLHLEITESAYPENSKQIISMVDQLRSRGFIIEMDDFGSGYSSLNMLSQLRLDVLKLDMKFIQNETAQNSDRGILRLMVEMAHRMNLSVVAEGVETQQQLSRLQEIGCDYVQGYLFSKPLPQEEYDILLCRFSQQLDIPLPSVPKLAQPHPYLLAAEEDPRCRKLLREAFAETYEVVEVVDCAQALEFLACHAQELSAMIVSSTLPEPGAPVIISALRRATAPRRIPVMVMTPPQRELEVQDLGLDVDDIAYKPRDLLCLHCLRRRMEWMHTLAAYQSRERSVVSEACQDYLTGLLNRRGLQAAMDAMQKSDFPIAVYLFDIDCLRQANDQLGHGAGDRILKHFADVLRRNTRRGDILCRYGGDEFVMVLKAIPSADAVRRKGADICAGITQLQFPEGYSATCSGGVVLCVEADVCPSVLIERAEEALEQAKHLQKGTCLLWGD